MLLSDYKFTPKTDKATIERGIKFLEQTQHSLIKGDVANQNGMYCIHALEEQHDNKILNGACHRQIDYGTHGYGNTHREVDLVSTLTHRLEKYPYFKTWKRGNGSYNVDPAITEEFTRWFTQQSIYSRFFIPMPLEFNVEFGLLISSDIPAPLLQNMCIISRHTREKEPSMIRWMEYVQKGIDPCLAFVLATNTYTDGGSVFPMGNQHFTLPAGLSIKDAAVRAILGDFRGISDTDKTYREKTAYTGGSAYLVSAGKNMHDGSKHWMFGLRDKLTKKDTLVSKIPNPFKKPVNLNGSMPLKQFDEEIVPLFVSEVESIVQNYFATKDALVEKAA